VSRRAELMQAAVPAGEGAMAAILVLDDDVVASVCRSAAEGQVESAVNFNSPGQVVIAGDRAAVERASEHAKAVGAKRAMLLSVSVPAHCDLMRPAAAEFSAALADTDFTTPSLPVVNNVDVQVYDSVERIRDGLERQLYSPVRWTGTIHFLVEHGARRILEAGPGKVLTGLVRRIDRAIPAVCLDTPAALQEALAQREEQEQ
jgi:[acyl-carrier-protein] S-malonyltransferase